MRTSRVSKTNVFDSPLVDIFYVIADIFYTQFILFIKISIYGVFSYKLSDIFHSVLFYIQF